MNSKSLIRYIVLLTFCAVASFMTSCIQEDMMECRLYVRFKYDKTSFPSGQEPEGSYRNNYFGPTKLGVSIIYIIK